MALVICLSDESLLGFFIILYSFSKIDDETLKGITQGIAQSFKGEKGGESASRQPSGLIPKLGSCERSKCFSN